jgi:Mg-chelatase subunit ChlD
VRHALRITIASAVLAALVVPALAPGQNPKAKKAAQKAAAQPKAAATLSESPTSGFPDKAYLLALPAVKRLTASQVSVTENGGDVSGLEVAPPGGDKSGAILLIDASNSMRGAPINQAMAASRGFLAERKKNLPVAIVVFGPDDSVLSDFTVNGQELQKAVSTTPPTAEGTHIYDALTNVAGMAEDKGLERTTVVLLSDGTDVGSDASRAEALEAAMYDLLSVL